MLRPKCFGVPLAPNDTAAPLHCQGLWRVGKDARPSRREEESAARFPNLSRFSLERRCKECSSKRFAGWHQTTEIVLRTRRLIIWDSALQRRSRGPSSIEVQLRKLALV